MKHMKIILTLIIACYPFCSLAHESPLPPAQRAEHCEKVIQGKVTGMYKHSDFDEHAEIYCIEIDFISCSVDKDKKQKIGNKIFMLKSLADSRGHVEPSIEIGGIYDFYLTRTKSIHFIESALYLRDTGDARRVLEEKAKDGE